MLTPPDCPTCSRVLICGEEYYLVKCLYCGRVVYCHHGRHNYLMGHDTRLCPQSEWMEYNEEEHGIVELVPAYIENLVCPDCFKERPWETVMIKPE